MFLSLLAVTLLVALVVSFAVARLFDTAVARILGRLVGPEISDAWHRYIMFAVYVVGVSRGVRLYDLERYVLPRTADEPQLVLDAQRWTFEVFRTVVVTLQGIAWMLLVVFLVALVAYVLLRGFELRAGRRDGRDDGPAARPPEAR